MKSFAASKSACSTEDKKKKDKIDVECVLATFTYIKLLNTSKFCNVHVQETEIGKYSLEHYNIEIDLLRLLETMIHKFKFFV